MKDKVSLNHVTYQKNLFIFRNYKLMKIKKYLLE